MGASASPQIRQIQTATRNLPHLGGFVSWGQRGIPGKETTFIFQLMSSIQILSIANYWLGIF